MMRVSGVKMMLLLQERCGWSNATGLQLERWGWSVVAGVCGWGLVAGVVRLEYFCNIHEYLMIGTMTEYGNIRNISNI